MGSGLFRPKKKKSSRDQEIITETTMSSTKGIRPEYDHLFKLLLIGDEYVGKTSFLTRAVDGYFAERLLPNAHMDFKVKMIEMDACEYKLQIWDAAGQERFRAVTSSYYRGGHGIVLVYDVTNKESFVNVKRWFKESQRYCSNTTQFILVGTKSDLVEGRKVEYEEGKALADELQIEFFETSAHLGTNIEESLRNITVSIVSTL
eukprot:TRINITY_DN628_c0_g1_i1.p1 TRINITY_DN628_c0_g1~~TRINITY_DN628_c0_g1_i1.p1  ORF type:complete len:214 (-),score=49.29 TRINITY_DN628_c0_g1_i1:173-784(-)